MTRYSAIVLVLLGAAAGYSLGGPSAKAQSGGLPYMEGDRLTLRYDRQSNAWPASVECRVVATIGSYVRCAPSDAFQTQRVEDWRSLQGVTEILKHEK
jgi:hypothetical protein